MKLARNLRVGQKLALSGILIVFLFTAASAVFIYQSNSVMKNFSYFFDHPYRVTNTARSIKSDILSMRIAGKDVLLSGNSEDTSALLEKISLTREKVAGEIDTLRRDYLGNSTDIDAFEEKYEKWGAVLDQGMSLASSGNKDTAAGLSLGAATAYANDMLAQLDTIIDFANSKAASYYSQADSAYIFGEMATMVFFTAIILVSIATVTIMTKHITRPLLDMIRVINLVESGQEVSGVPTGGRRDELGKVTEAFNRMLVYLKSERDLNELKLSVEHQKTLEQFRITLMSIGDAVISVDVNKTITNMNPMAEKITGWLLGDAVGRHVDDVFTIINAKTEEKAENPLTKVLQLGTVMGLANHTVLISKDGERHHIADSAAPIRDEKGELFGVVLVFRDVTDDYHKQEEIVHMSFHDKLTGLYNRAFFEEEILRMNTARQMPLSVIMGDINGLKLINDTFGHHEGDRYLVTAANVLKSCCREEDIVARWGGDEFVILLPKTSAETSQGICNRIIGKYSTIKDFAIAPSIAVGCAVQKEVNPDYQKVLKEAETNMYRHKLLESSSIRSAIVASLDNSMKERDFITEEHALAMASICSDVGKRLGFSESQCDELELLARLHDIGKIAIHDSILMKPESLTQDEWELMKRHSEIGYRIAKSISGIEHAAEGILSHHERWDGAGYPRGLSGEDIPYSARIIAVADAYDAMTRGRPYKAAISHEQAVAELKRCAGTQFDARVTDVFLLALEERRRGKAQDTRAG